MKNQIPALLLLTFLATLLSCSGTKKTNGTGDEISLWVNSSTQDATGKMNGACFGINREDTLTISPFGQIENLWEPFCGTIAGFEYEEGFLYRVKIKKTKNIRAKAPGSPDISEWKLVEMISKEKDTHFQRREMKTAWIGPKQIEVRCGNPMTPPDCKELRHQAQFGTLDKTGNWEPLYDLYALPDYEEGYIYQVRYTKVYLSEFESRMIADHVGYRIEGLEVLSKTKA